MASPSLIPDGQTTSVIWTWSYTTPPVPQPTCSIDNGVGALTSGEAHDVTLVADTTFTLTCNNSAGSDTTQAIILVDLPNQLPDPVGDVGRIVCVEQTVELHVLANDTDPDGDTLTVASVAQASHGAVTTDGSVVVYSPDVGCVGPDSFTYTASDGNGGSADGTVALTVTQPELSSLFPTSGSTGQPLQLFGECLGATAGSVTLGGRTATLVSWTPRYAVAVAPGDFAPGSYDVVATTSDTTTSNSLSYEMVPWIGAVDLDWGLPDDAQSVLGDSFDSEAGVLSYNATQATTGGSTNTVIQSHIPKSLTPGWTNIQVQTTGGLVSNLFPIAVVDVHGWITPQLPWSRKNHVAVWTGTEMIVWGGEQGYREELKSGARYNPRFDTWATMSTTGAPSGCDTPTGVWTGSEMIVWGDCLGGAYNGGRYDPGTDIWSPVSNTNAPSRRTEQTAVWTGTEMIIWGGTYNYSGRNTGARYDPSTGAWTPLSTTGAPAGRAGHVAVWTGSEMIVWGGATSSSVEVNTGARYNPATDTWAPLPTASAPSSRVRAVHTSSGGSR